MKYKFGIILLIFSYLLLFFSSNVNAQDYNKIDLYVKNLKLNTSDVGVASNLITKNSNNQSEKIRAIYTWVAHHIHYDPKQSLKNQPKETRGTIAERTLKNKRGVCYHFAKLFEELCNRANIECYLITGFTSDRNSLFAETGHAWNAVRINDEFKFIDVTWGSGYERDGEFIKEVDYTYYLNEPTDFIKTHIPFDPLWQLLDQPISYESFLAREFSNLHPLNDLNEINNFLQKDTLQQLIDADARIKATGSFNKLVLKEQQFLIDEIHYRYYDRSIDITNQGIVALNKIIAEYNKFVEKKAYSLSLAKENFDLAYTKLYEADYLLSNIHTSNQTLLDLIITHRNKVAELNNHLEENRSFVNKAN